MESKSLISKLLIVCVVIACSLAFIFVLFNFKENLLNDKATSPTASTSENSENFQLNVHQNLIEKNNAYIRAESYMKSRNYGEASTQYNLALDVADDINEQGQIKYKIAQMHVFQDMPIEAIQIFKEITLNEDYLPELRAFATQQTGALLYSYNSEAVYDEVFRGEPYSKFNVENDSLLSYRNLYEYGASLHRLGVLESRVAKLYSIEAVRLYKSGRSDAETMQRLQEVKLIARQRIANADLYLANLKEGDPNLIYKGEILLRKASVLGDLRITGENVPDPESIFAESLQVAASTGRIVDEASIKFAHALFLSRMYGVERAEQVQMLLSEFYSTNKYSNSGVVRSIMNQATNPKGILTDDLIILSNIDSRFAEYVRSGGSQI